MMPTVVFLGTLLAATSVREGDFVLSVTTLAALERGPHVVQVTLTYLGQEPVIARLYRMRDANVRLVSLSPNFLMSFYRSVDTDASTLIVDVLFSKSTSMTERYYLHQLEQKYRSEGVPFEAKSEFKYWRTEHEQPKGEPIAVSLRKKLLLTRTKSTPSRLSQIQATLIERIHESYSLEDWAECREWLCNTQMMELCPVAIRMLDTTNEPNMEWFSFDYLIGCSGGIDEAKRLLISELKKPDLASASVFVAWKHPRFRLPTKAEVESLLESPNRWVPGLTVAAFPEQLKKQQIDAVREQLRQHLKPQPSEDFLGLLNNFESPRYVIRESATKKMTSLGEKIEAMALAELAKSPFAETESRLQRVLVDMGKLDPFPESFRVIRALKRMQTSQAREILLVISEGPPGLRSTREAKKTIERLKGTPTP